MRSAPIWCSTSSTVSIWYVNSSEDPSTTCSMRSAPLISSSVDLNDSTSVVGSFRMKPIVSVMVTSRPSGNLNLRVVESSVANSLS